MKTQWFEIWDYLRSSLWFVPTVMALAAIAGAFGTVALDERMTTEWLGRLGWRYTGGAEGASLMLSTLAGSMIAIAGTVFSLTLVALSLATTQLGPGLLRNFMRDTTNHVVLGTFLATFLYCMLVLRTIRRADESVFVPHLSVSIAILLGTASLGVLIYFIHHVSVSIQTEEVVARVGRDLIRGIDRLFPGPSGQLAPQNATAASEAGLPEAFEHEARPIGSDEDGYLQRIDLDALAALAEREDLRIRLERRPGQYLVKGHALLTVWPGDRVDDTLAQEVHAALVIGHQRTDAQDVEFTIIQLVEIAVRALSPGINDPFTAIACIDRLGAGLCRLAMRDMPSASRFDTQGHLRLVAPGCSFVGLLGTAFSQIRQNARADPAILTRLLETIAQVATVAHRCEDRVALARHAAMIARAAREAVPEAEDRLAVEERFEAVMLVLMTPADGDQTNVSYQDD